MKPTFALDLTREAIALLYRTPKGWLSVGEVAFDAPDLAETLDYLRKTALGLSPMGLACKLILPNVQILYTEVHAPGPSRDDKRRQIAAALEGRTPYAVEDLVFDWSGKGQTVKVAVVARETLEEAEAFAVSHRLNPVSFVAIPAAGDFVGEPWFGPAAAAAALLAPGESVDRDREPVATLQRDAAGAAVQHDPEPTDGSDAAIPEAGKTVAAETLEEAQAPASPLTSTGVAPADKPDAKEEEPLPGLEEALNADLLLPELVDPARVPLLPLGATDNETDELDEAALAAALADGPQARDALADPVTAAMPDPTVPDRLATKDAARPADTPKVTEVELTDTAAAVMIAGTPASASTERFTSLQPEAAGPVPARADASLPMPKGANTVPPVALTPEVGVTTEIATPIPVDLTSAVPFATEAPLPRQEARAPAPFRADEAPFADVSDSTAFPEDLDLPPMKASAPALPPSVLDEDLPPAPPAAAMVAFASRRAAGNASAARALDGAARAAAALATPGPARANPALADPAPPRAVAVPKPAAGGGAAQPPRPSVAPRSFPGLVTAPTIPGVRPRPKVKIGLTDPGLAAGATSAAASTRPAAVKSPARPGGTFGAAPARNRSGVALMVLVGLLLLFLAFIAAVSAYFLSGNGTTAVDRVELSDPIAVVPGVEDEMLADMQDPEGMSDPLPEAEGRGLAAGDAGALATERLDEGPVETVLPVDPAASAAVALDPVDLVAQADGGAQVETVEAAGLPAAPANAEPATAEAAPESPPPAAPATEAAAEAPAPTPAPATVVATDVAAAEAPVEDQDEIFLAAMDAPPPALDALALPDLGPIDDSTPPAPMPPPAFGTVYQFDEQGLLVPTPGGILSPEGVMLFAGPPPLVPPTRSEAAAEAARAAAALAPAPVAAAPGSTEGDEGAIDPAAPATAADASLVTTGVAPDPVAETAADEGAPADPALSGVRPRPRPADLAPAPDDDAALDRTTDSAFAALRPLPRPQIVLAAAAAARPDTAADLGAQGASLTAQAEAELAAAAALEAANPSIVAISRRPEPRPDDLSRAVEAAVAAAVREPEPELAAASPDLKPEEADELDEGDVADAGPSIPSNASVAKQATFKNAINLSKMNLIGTYGTDSRRTALIRQSNGRYKKVEVGDKIDGGTIVAITEGEVRYQKGGRVLTLEMPRA